MVKIVQTTNRCYLRQQDLTPTTFRNTPNIPKKAMAPQLPGFNGDGSDEDDGELYDL